MEPLGYFRFEVSGLLFTGCRDLGFRGDSGVSLPGI